MNVCSGEFDIPKGAPFSPSWGAYIGVPNCGRKATPHLFYLCRESESGGSISKLSKKLHLFPRKWAAPGTVCGQPVGRNAALPIYLCCCCCCTLSLHCTPLCAVLCTAVRQLLCTAGQCFVHGGALLHSVHSARRPAVGSRLAEGSGVHRLLQGSAVGGGCEGKVEARADHTTTSCLKWQWWGRRVKSLKCERRDW